MNAPILPVDVLRAANPMPSVVATLEQSVRMLDGRNPISLFATGKYQ
jgi:hypothetical protein